MATQNALEAAARAWCAPKTKHYVMNPDLAEAFANILDEQMSPMGGVQPVTFRGKVQHIVNCHSKENGSDTPDFILADYLIACLANFDRTLQAREKWYGRDVRQKRATGTTPCCAPKLPEPTAKAKPGERYTVAVDFDGVLHEYATPWVNAHTIADGPVEGAIEWLFTTIQKMDVVIFSTRCKTWRGRSAIRRWLKQHAGNLWWPSPEYSIGLEDVKLTYTKIPALVYLDDRAMRFEGDFPSVEAIHRAKPWNKAA